MNNNDTRYRVEAQIGGNWVTISADMIEPEAHIVMNQIYNSSINATDMRVVPVS